MNYMPQISKILNTFPEVEWEKYVGSLSGIVRIYGWITREGKPRDFISLDIEDGKTFDFLTSASDLAETFARRLGYKVSTYEGTSVNGQISQINEYKVGYDEESLASIPVFFVESSIRVGSLKLKREYYERLNPNSKFILEGRYNNMNRFKVAELLILPK